MPACQSCGTSLPADARFCPQCAAPVVGPEGGSASAARGKEPAAGTGTETGSATAEPGEAPAAGTETQAGGASAGDSPAAATPAPATHTGLSQQNWAVFAHLSALAPLIVGVPLTFLGPLVLWLLARDRGPYVRDQAAEALNFNISWLVWGLVLLVAGFAVSIPTFGVAMFPALALLGALGIAWLVLVVVAAVRASGGERYRYPLTIRFITDYQPLK